LGIKVDLFIAVDKVALAVTSGNGTVVYSREMKSRIKSNRPVQSTVSRRLSVRLAETSCNRIVLDEGEAQTSPE